MLLIYIAIAIIWLNVGVLSSRAMEEISPSPSLEDFSVPVRIVLILLAPIMFLVYERHVFFSQKNPDIGEET